MVRKGQKYERLLKAKLLEFPDTIVVIRSAGSKGSGDLTVLQKRKVFIIEVKSCKGNIFYPSKDPEQFEMLKEISEAQTYLIEKYYAVWFLNRAWEFFRIDEDLKRCKLGEGESWQIFQ